MSVGIVMLVHTALDRAERLVRHWVAGDCPVVVHVDLAVDSARYDAFAAALADLDQVRLAPRHRCEWGTWGIVAATQGACEIMLDAFPQVRHVHLASGSCVPLRPVREFVAYLDHHPRTDFIESATTADVPWIVGGLAEERFTLRFPFSWRRHRALFDRYVSFQRRIGFRRRIPPGIVPHLGSQWWCLTRATLAAILQSPDRAAHDHYFKRVWIPDESYFQTLARRYSSRIESRSLTLSKFDNQGKPYIFYDDHLQLLRRSDCFVARKIWPHAHRLYEAFLTDANSGLNPVPPNPGKIERIFARAVERRTRGRPGLIMQGRYPHDEREAAVTAAPYSVFHGFSELFADWEDWLSRETDARVHGHLFAPERAAFHGRESQFTGALSDSAVLRDYDPQGFLTSLIWNTRGERQAFQFGPGDAQGISWTIAKDANAQIAVITGAWAVSLFRAGGRFDDLRETAARLQKAESAHLEALRSSYARANVRSWTLAEFLTAPMEFLQSVIDDMTSRTGPRLTEVPQMHDLTGFAQFLQNLKNQGMHPYLAGDFPVDAAAQVARPQARKPYLVR